MHMTSFNYTHIIINQSFSWLFIIIIYNYRISIHAPKRDDHDNPYSSQLLIKGNNFYFDPMLKKFMKSKLLESELWM